MNVNKMYINGEWVNSQSNKTFVDYSPVTDSDYALITDADQKDTKRAIEAAHAAFPAWSALQPEERANYLLKVAEALENNEDEISKHLIEEIGSWIGKSKVDLKTSVGFWKAGAKIPFMVEDEVLESPIGKKSVVKRIPLGVVSVITPWNVPLNLSSRTTSGILAVGNTVVLKPSEESPITGGLILAKAFEEAGVPPGVFNVVTSSRNHVVEVGEEMVTNPLVKAISFIGSENVGRQIATKAASQFKKTSMELGGKDALIVMDDADISKAVTAAAFGAFYHAGQICIGTKRIYVDEKIAEEFIKRFVAKTKALGIGDVYEFSKPIGPLINHAALEKIKHQLNDAVEKGATVLAGGNHDGLYFNPTILTGVTQEMETYGNETFGPMVAIYPYATVEDALKEVNNIDYGLSGGVMAGSEEKANAVAMKMESGMCHVNDGTIYGEPFAPFGGMKNSGMGRYGGKASVESFTQQRWITVEQGTRPYPPMFNE
mgnify:FL=1